MLYIRGHEGLKCKYARGQGKEKNENCLCKIMRHSVSDWMGRKDCSIVFVAFNTSNTVFLR